MGPDHSSVAKLQRDQNAAMRVITAAHSNTPIDHLHAETKLLPVRDSLELNCKQFLANALTIGHPSHSVVQLPSNQRPGRKSIVHTLQSRYRDAVEPYLTNGIMLESNYKKAIKDMHTKQVEKSRRSITNDILGRHPPDVHLLERSLPRISQRTLCQLRCDKCICLETYKLSIGIAADDLCPICCGEPHTSHHLFNCPASPTNLNFLDLWKRPHDAVNYLRTLASFDHLPRNPSP
jgi:hypothetical protein